MKIMVIGSGAREHALVWKLAQSKKTEKIYAAPGNGGTAKEEKTENLILEGADPLTEKGQKILLEFAKKQNIDLTVVGPEAPLGAGIAGRFREAGLAIIGPGEKAARLETSKVYAKSFMEKYGVRTAKAKSFTNPDSALEYALKHFGANSKAGVKKSRAGKEKNPDSFKPAPPLVIKADGLAAGKGVVIAKSMDEAKNSINAFMKKGVLGEAGKKIIIEQYLEGLEVTVQAAVSVSPGKPLKQAVIKPFLSARDHKRRFEGGLGPNTGGMGAIAPVPDFTAAIQKDFETAILAPTLKGIVAEKLDYQGFIFFGLMILDGLCRLLEYNVRLGDPETQAVLPLMDSDFTELCEAMLNGTLADFTLKWNKGAVCAPVAASEGYPGSYKSGDPIAINPLGLKRSGAKIFVAGAKTGAGGALGSGLRTSGGRVLTVSAIGNDPDDARTKAYEALGFVRFDGMVYRRDIGREQKESGEDRG